MRLAGFAVLLLFVVGRSQGEEIFLKVGLQKGSDFATVQEAIDQVPADNQEQRIIFIRQGDYFGHFVLNKPRVTLRGEGPATRLHFNLGQAMPGANGAPIEWRGASTLHITPEGSDAVIENLTLENTFGKGMQAQACSVEADRVAFRRCLILGWQDTIRLEVGRQWFDHCYIAGHVDFIYGGAAALFSECEIHCRAEGYIVAPATPPGQAGFVFERCRVTFPYGDPLTYLGRPWRESPAAVFIDCELGAGVRPEGWKEWRVEPAKVRFAEYGSRGPGASNAARAPWAKAQAEPPPAEATPAAVLRDWHPVGRN